MSAEPTPPAEGEAAGVPEERLKRAVIWAWLMIPVMLVSTGIAAALGYAFMAALGVPHGGLLSSAGAWGLVATVVVEIVIFAPLVVGVMLARWAHLHGARTALAPMVVESVLLLAGVGITMLSSLVSG